MCAQTIFPRVARQVHVADKYLARKREALIFDHPLKVEDFQYFACVLRMMYAGPAVDTEATKSSSVYRLDPQLLPSYPEDIPLLYRKTYWWWSPKENVQDVLIASLHGVLLLLFELMQIDDPADPRQFPGALQKLCLWRFLPGDFFYFYCLDDDCYQNCSYYYCCFCYHYHYC